MSKYDELRKEYSDYFDAEVDFVEENRLLARLIVDGFRVYLDCPETFASGIGNSKSAVHYITWHSIDEKDETKEESGFWDALSHEWDGSFTFAFGVAVEKAPNTYPKRRLILHVECKRYENIVKIDISGFSVDVAFDGKECPEIEKVHETAFEAIKDWLQKRPGDANRSQKIGFI